MVTLFIMQMVIRLAHFGNEVRDTWTETQQLRRSLPGPAEE
jgi:hypothetical protein